MFFLSATIYYVLIQRSDTTLASARKFDNRNVAQLIIAKFRQNRYLNIKHPLTKKKKQFLR